MLSGSGGFTSTAPLRFVFHSGTGVPPHFPLYISGTYLSQTFPLMKKSYFFLLRGYGGLYYPFILFIYICALLGRTDKVVKYEFNYLESGVKHIFVWFAFKIEQKYWGI